MLLSRIVKCRLISVNTDLQSVTERIQDGTLVVMYEDELRPGMWEQRKESRRQNPMVYKVLDVKQLRKTGCDCLLDKEY